MLESFITAFIIYFVVIDPVGNAPIFLAVTEAQDRARKLAEANKNDFVRNIIDFITTESDRSYLVPKG